MNRLTRAQIETMTGNFGHDVTDKLKNVARKRKREQISAKSSSENVSQVKRLAETQTITKGNDNENLRQATRNSAEPSKATTQVRIYLKKNNNDRYETNFWLILDRCEYSYIFQTQ